MNKYTLNWKDLVQKEKIYRWQTIKLKEAPDERPQLSSFYYDICFPGVYCFINQKTNEILYIGGSSKVGERITHFLMHFWNFSLYPEREYFSEGMRKENININDIVCKIKRTEIRFDYLRLEASLINRLKPRFNQYFPTIPLKNK